MMPNKLTGIYIIELFFPSCRPKFQITLSFLYILDVSNCSIFASLGFELALILELASFHSTNMIF